MKQWNVGIVGATGMVGQRLVSLLDTHPWFRLTALAASARSAAKPYAHAVAGRWALPTPVPAQAAAQIVLDARDVLSITRRVDFIFCAVDLNGEQARALEQAYAQAECPVVSCSSAHRMTPDVPMIIPEINPEHLEVIAFQKKRLGTARGFIVAKSNCSLQSYVPALHPLHNAFGLRECLVCTYQAISGAGKTLEDWPEMQDNCIPFIDGEEEKSQVEPLKLWGTHQQGTIVCADAPNITAQCMRVACTDGHMAAVFARFEKTPSMEDILSLWGSFSGEPQRLCLPHAPKQLLHYFEQPDRPQTKLDRGLEAGMAISVGRLRPDTQYDCKFVCLSHNTLRGAAGGAMLLAELLAAKGYFD